MDLQAFALVEENEIQSSGYESIPAEWLQAIQRRDWIEEVLEKETGLTFTTEIV